MHSTIDDLILRYPKLEVCKESIKMACDIIYMSYLSGGTLFLCGNGGSNSDCEHIVGELMKDFSTKRSLSNKDKRKIAEQFGPGEYPVNLVDNLQYGIPAINLNSHPSLMTAYSNDREGRFGFAQQLFVLGKGEDTLFAISTSGNSKNVYYAAQVARSKGMEVISLTGEKESLLSEISNLCIRVPETETYKIQELHLPVYHAICLELERRLLNGKEKNNQ